LFDITLAPLHPIQIPLRKKCNYFGYSFCAGTRATNFLKAHADLFRERFGGEPFDPQAAAADQLGRMAGAEAQARLVKRSNLPGQEAWGA
jgi:hypothetical protein